MTSPGVKHLSTMPVFFVEETPGYLKPDFVYYCPRRNKKQNSIPHMTYALEPDPNLHCNERQQDCAHGRVESCEATPIGLADESKESLYGRESQTGRDLRSACM